MDTVPTSDGFYRKSGRSIRAFAPDQPRQCLNLAHRQLIFPPGFRSRPPRRRRRRAAAHDDSPPAVETDAVFPQAQEPGDNRCRRGYRRPRGIEGGVKAKRLSASPKHRVGGYLGPKGMGAFLSGEYAAEYGDAGKVGYMQSHTAEHWGDELAAKLGTSPGKFGIEPDGEWRPVHVADGPSSIHQTMRVLRGGSFNYLATFLRSAYRNDFVPTFRHNFNIGIRPARTLRLDPVTSALAGRDH
jgi:hypothetical protein